MPPRYYTYSERCAILPFLYVATSTARLQNSMPLDPFTSMSLHLRSSMTPCLHIATATANLQTSYRYAYIVLPELHGSMSPCLHIPRSAPHLQSSSDPYIHVATPTSPLHSLYLDASTSLFQSSRPSEVASLHPPLYCQHLVSLSEKQTDHPQDRPAKVGRAPAIISRIFQGLSR